MDKKYNYKQTDEQCKCNDFRHLNWYDKRISFTGKGWYNKYHCTKCGKDIEIYKEIEKEKEESGYYHDGGWYRNNE